MNSGTTDAKAIFLQALDCADADVLRRYLDQACGTDAALRTRVEELLRAHRDAGAFLGGPGNEPSLMEIPGTSIGPYKLLESIGEGGFGVVFMAEQTEPIRRKVALKVLKPGMDTRQVVARFEAERQALAMMDHPNIARIFDGGQTPSGRPYFVMELVSGTPITEFCDQNQLTVRERLHLFVDVCQAVQHAHQKGIIHRDLKPSNILIAFQDGTPKVKVIDFGIAKAMSGHLTDKTLFTGFAQMLGTPLYVSPEQISQGNVDVDTRSDIYSMGVLLYELLTGTTPFDKEQLSALGHDEMRRIIREEEPSKPSTRASRLGEAATTVSASRKSEPQKLSKQIRGELDWIVMKSLDKDRNRRYDTASAFAADVQQYLNNEPVQACPPSARYRLRKFLLRYKATVVAVAVVLLTLLGGTVGTSIGLVRAERALDAEAIQRGLAEANEAKAEKALAEAQVNYARAETNFREAFWCLEHVLNAFDPNRSFGDVTVAELKQYQTNEALRFLKLFCEQTSDEPAKRLQQGVAHVHTGRIYQVLANKDKALQEFREAITVFGRLVEDFPEEAKYAREYCWALHMHAAELHTAGKIPDANRCYVQCKLAIDKAVRKHPADVASLRLQANILCRWPDLAFCDPEGALKSAQKAVELDMEGPRNWLALGVANYRCGKWKDAENSLQKSLAILKEGDWTKAQIACFLAMAQWQCGMQAEAHESYQLAFRVMHKNFDARNLTLLAETAALLGIEGPPTAKAKEVNE